MILINSSSELHFLHHVGCLAKDILFYDSATVGLQKKCGRSVVYNRGKQLFASVIFSAQFRDKFHVPLHPVIWLCAQKLGLSLDLQKNRSFSNNFRADQIRFPINALLKIPQPWTPRDHCCRQRTRRTGWTPPTPSRFRSSTQTQGFTACPASKATSTSASTAAACKPIAKELQVRKRKNYLLNLNALNFRRQLLQSHPLAVLLGRKLVSGKSAQRCCLRQ
jgi:hypothetical protein